MKWGIVVSSERNEILTDSVIDMLLAKVGEELKMREGQSVNFTASVAYKEGPSHKMFLIGLVGTNDK
jgi:hypothetical protein